MLYLMRVGVVSGLLEVAADLLMAAGDDWKVEKEIGAEEVNEGVVEWLKVVVVV